MRRKSELSASEATTIVEKTMETPNVIGCLVSSLRSAAVVKQQHRDGRSLDVFWRETAAGAWRCTVFLSTESELCLTQIDLYPQSGARVEAFEPCSVTINQKDGLLCIVRYDPRHLS
jgi:hypothetical protein